MQTIYKYALEVPSTMLDLPVGSIVLNVQLQRDVPTLWAIVDTDKPTHARRFHVMGTGHTLPWRRAIEYRYIATLQTSFGIVLHVFEDLTVERRVS